jgi:hypothetical protein
MGDMKLVDFSEVDPEAFPPQTLAPAPEKKTGTCAWPQCGLPLEKIGKNWFHLDGSSKCKATYATPKEEE